MILWGRSTSSNVQKPMWLFEELGIDYKRIDIGGPFGRNREPEYLALNPNGIVPTLDDNGFVLWESNTITRYIAAKYRAETMYPGDLKRRADVERWMDWASFTLSGAIADAFMGIIRTAPDKRDLNKILASCKATESAMRVLDAQLQDRDYVCGDSLTLADIAIGSLAYRWLHVPFNQVGYAIPNLPNVNAWYARLKARPAFEKVVVIEIK
jgi:glutathione S-transferase